jgi:hypothetical protein
MKDKNNKSLNKGTMLILGAGASIGAAKFPIESSLREAMAKMPSGDNFFYDLFFQGKTNTHDKRFLNVLGLTYEGLNDLIVRAWGLDKNLSHFDPEEWKQINIEEVFTFLDIGSRMYPRSTRYQKGFGICRSSLASFITSFLSVKSEGLHCEHLMDILFGLKPTDSIISFNWDTIADFTLQQAGRPIYSGYLDLMTKEPLRVSDYRDRPVLLKLHGSLNWIICPNPKCSLHGKPRLAVKRKKLQRFFSMHKCPQCGNERGEPFIVPPTSQKFIRRGTLLHKLWLIAREKLPFCKRLIFVGYSFPATDFYSEWLFRQIYFIDAQRPEIIVINPAIMKKKSQVTQRYEWLFRGCKIHRFATLQDFKRNGSHLLTDDRNGANRTIQPTARSVG